MRVADDLRRCVVFLGHPDGKGGFNAAGTGFFVGYEDRRYLVTVRHVAIELGEGRFAVRLNKLDGTSDNGLVEPDTDGVRWHFNSHDPDVDLAVMPFDIDLRGEGYDVLVLPSVYFVDSGLAEKWDIGIGDSCYAVGLFQIVPGKSRNIPVVHSGNIALMRGDEHIPMRNWLEPEPRLGYVDGYLVELQNLPGLSGSPVFVRPTVEIPGLPLATGEKFDGRLPARDVYLLGVWQGSWDGLPDATHAALRGGSPRVPVGMGTVVPAEKIVEILELAELRALRAKQEADAEWELAASPASAPAPTVPIEGDDDWLPPDEAARRRDVTIRNMLNTPPKPQSEMKLGRPRRR